MELATSCPVLLLNSRTDEVRMMTDFITGGGIMAGDLLREVLENIAAMAGFRI